MNGPITDLTGVAADLCRDLPDHMPSLRRYAMAIAGNRADCEDLVQETLIRAIVSLRAEREIRDLRSYLFSILHNVRVSQARGRDRGVVTISFDGLADELPTAGNQHDAAELKSVLSAVSHLPEEQRDVVVLVCVRGYAYREAAERLNVPVGTVMSRLSRARSRLQNTDSEHASAA